jgi:hypothetical protein
VTLTAERKIAACLQEVRPRAGFATELLHQLTVSPMHIHPLDSRAGRPRTAWIVAGTVAGVVSATGAVYLAARRHHHRRVA